MALKHPTHLLIFVAVFYVLAACSFSKEPIALPISTVESSLTSGTTQSPPTNTPYPSPSPTLDVPDATFTPTRLSTALPTLPPEEAEKFVLQLLDTNGNCQLPCWWGWIVPGKARWEDVNRFLQRFATKVNDAGENNGLVSYGVYFSVPDTIDMSKELIATFEVRDGIVEQILVGQPYALTDLLQENGKPTDILLEVSDDTFEAFSSVGKFTLVLFWRDKGILTVYEGRIDKTQPLSLCMNKLDNRAPSMWLWDPTKKKTIEEVGGELLFGTPPFQPKFHTLQKVIDIDIDTFYNTYSNPTNLNKCFQISDSFSP
jgi:hypothetical protein